LAEDNNLEICFINETARLEKLRSSFFENIFDKKYDFDFNRIFAYCFSDEIEEGVCLNPLGKKNLH